VKCVDNNLNGRFSQEIETKGLFGFSSHDAPNERSIAIYGESCLSNGEYYVSENPITISGLKQVDDDGKSITFLVILWSFFELKF
jgi:hypothetical protein